jgi:hypothetical protein
MSTDPPLHELPDHVTFDLRETAVLLGALDAAMDVPVPRHVEVRLLDAVRLVTAKLWPELGELLDDEEG